MAEDREKRLSDVADVIREAWCKHEFLREAIGRLWGNTESDYSDNKELLFGCDLLMGSVTEDLKNAFNQLENETTKETPSTVELLRKKEGNA
ncbi:MAG TPA: hypothetical protein DD713_08225 [Nitrospiraceae bacterium]|jgi:hypothetical protein|nr:hypothetical protein [Nitrospiraceae bacterium]